MLVTAISTYIATAIVMCVTSLKSGQFFKKRSSTFNNIKTSMTVAKVKYLRRLLHKYSYVQIQVEISNVHTQGMWTLWEVDFCLKKL